METLEKSLLNDDDALKKIFEEVESFYKEQIKEAEEEIKRNLEIINKNLSKVEEEIREAEESGDELAYRAAFAKKQLILQKLQEFEALSKNI